MILMILKDGFEETEAIATWDFIKRAGIDIKLVSDKKEITGTHGLLVKTDCLFSDVEKNNVEGVVLPGGQPGSDNLFNCDKTKEILEFCYDKGLLIGAICAAPYILGKREYLKGKNATCFPGFEGELLEAEVKDEKAVSDGNIITAKGMGASFKFGFEIVKYLKGEDCARKVKESIFAD